MKKSLCHFQLKLSVSIKYHGFSECMCVSVELSMWNMEYGQYEVETVEMNEWKLIETKTEKCALKNYAISCGTKGTFSLSHFESKYIYKKIRDKCDT